MIKEFKEAFGKKEFILRANLDKILEKLEFLKQDYEENEYVTVYYREFDDEQRNYLSEAEYLENIEKVISLVKKLDDTQLLKYISEFGKKKNGTFNRRSKIEIINCENSTFNGEYCGRWDFYSLQVRALNDLEIELDLYDTQYQMSGF